MTELLIALFLFGCGAFLGFALASLVFGARAIDRYIQDHMQE